MNILKYLISQYYATTALVIIAVSFFNCSAEPICSENEAFMRKFEESVNIVKSTRCMVPSDNFVDQAIGYIDSYVSTSFYTNEVLDAKIFLSAVTNEYIEMSDQHFPYHTSLRDYHQDIYHLEDWYEKNKCRYTLQQTDSLVLLYETGQLILEK